VVVESVIHGFETYWCARNDKHNLLKTRSKKITLTIEMIFLTRQFGDEFGRGGVFGIVTAGPEPARDFLETACAFVSRIGLRADIMIIIVEIVVYVREVG
jgi:hypothetical protein